MRKASLYILSSKTHLSRKVPLVYCPLMGISKRIRIARKNSDLSQEALGALVGGVSKAAVMQWEKGITLPTADKLVQLANSLRVPISWLLTGQPLPEQDANGKLSWNVTEGRTVPLLTARQVVTGTTAYDGLPRVSCIFPCSDRAFATIIDDRANAPTLQPDDRVVWEPAATPEPEDIVLAISHQVARPIVGQYRLEANGSGFVTIIQPLNTAFPAVRSDRCELMVIGVLHEHTRAGRTARP